MGKRKISMTNMKSKKISPEEVCSILRMKYNVPQADIDYLDDEFRLRLLEDLQNTPMLNEE